MLFVYLQNHLEFLKHIQKLIKHFLKYVFFGVPFLILSLKFKISLKMSQSEGNIFCSAVSLGSLPGSISPQPQSANQSLRLPRIGGLQLHPLATSTRHLSGKFDLSAVLTLLCPFGRGYELRLGIQLGIRKWVWFFKG